MKATSTKPILLMRYGLIAFGILIATHASLQAGNGMKILSSENNRTLNKSRNAENTYNDGSLGQNANKSALKNLAFDVNGKVIDSKGQALPGVNIVVRDSQKGTTTNANGEFLINVDSQSDVLVFSFIGYKTQTVTVGSQKQISVTLEEDTNVLNEVVVTALGISREKNLLVIQHNRLRVM